MNDERESFAEHVLGRCRPVGTTADCDRRVVRALLDELDRRPGRGSSIWGILTMAASLLICGSILWAIFLSPSGPEVTPIQEEHDARLQEMVEQVKGSGERTALELYLGWMSDEETVREAGLDRKDAQAALTEAVAGELVSGQAKVKFVRQIFEDRVEGGYALLAKYLKDAGSTPRLLCAYMLGHLGAKEYADRLVELLKDEEAFVRPYAAYSLCLMGLKKYEKAYAPYLQRVTGLLERVEVRGRGEFWRIGNVYLVGRGFFSKVLDVKTRKLTGRKLRVRGFLTSGYDCYACEPHTTDRACVFKVLDICEVEVLDE